jgi:hypothetical protein
MAKVVRQAADERGHRQDSVSVVLLLRGSRRRAGLVEGQADTEGQWQGDWQDPG